MLSFLSLKTKERRQKQPQQSRGKHEGEWGKKEQVCLSATLTARLTAAAGKRNRSKAKTTPTPQKNGEVLQGVQAGRGHVRGCVQGAQQGHGRDCRAQAHPPRLDRRGRPVHCNPRDLAPQRACPSVHRQALRCDLHRAQADACFRVPRARPQKAHGRVRGRACTSKDQNVHVPAPPWHRFLPRAPRSSPRPEATKPSDQQARRAQACRFRPGPGVRDSRADVFARGCDAVVPRPRRSDGLHKVQHPHRHVERRLHLCRDGHGQTALPWQQRPGPARTHLQGHGHPQPNNLAGGHRAPRVQARLPCLPGTQHPRRRARPGSARLLSALGAPSVRPQQANFGSERSSPSVL